MTITVPAGGPFAGISANSAVHMQAFAPYTGTNGVVTAGDATADFKFGNGASDPTNDVQQCASPCNPSTSYYPLVDLVGASLGNEIFQSSFE
jgi:hypothetical protein